jgi:serine/threonine protein kinase
VAAISVFEKLKGRYEFEGVIAQEAMGTINRTQDLRLKRPGAVRAIRDISDETSLKLFERECELLGRFSHPSVIEIFDVGEFSEPVAPGRSVEILSQAWRASRLPTSKALCIATSTQQHLRSPRRFGEDHRSWRLS